MSQSSEEMRRLDLVEIEQEKKIVNALNTIPFGPCDIDVQAWKRLKLAVGAYSTGRNAKKTCLVLLGELRKKGFLIKDVVQLMDEFSARVKKIEREARKEKLILVGICHTQLGDSLNPSHAERIAWLSLMLEFNRPLLYFMISADSLRLAAYSIPPKAFYKLKEAIKFIPFEVRE